MFVCLVCFLSCNEEGSSPVSLQLLRGGIWACMRFTCLCLCWGLGSYDSQLPKVWYYVVLGAVSNMLVRNASPRGPIYFRYPMFSLSGPCKLLFLLCFIASWT